MDNQILIKTILKCDLCKWEQYVLEQFNKVKPLEELLQYVDEDNIADFLVNLADGLNVMITKKEVEDTPL